jgi:hypothetical protein
MNSASDVAERNATELKLNLPDLNPSSWGVSLSDWGFHEPFSGSSDLGNFDLPSAMVQPLLRALRHVNTTADTLFYDVNLLWLRLYTKGVLLSTNMLQPPGTSPHPLAALQAAAKFINLSAAANPEGAILVVDAHRAPFVQKYDDVETFLATQKGVEVISVTGVGSSALGSAAFAWNVSEAVRKPVAAIVHRTCCRTSAEFGYLVI